MNEDTRKLKLSKRRAKGRWQSYWVKPSGKFWKRHFNKKVRRGATYKRSNWFEWS